MLEFMAGRNHYDGAKSVVSPTFKIRLGVKMEGRSTIHSTMICIAVNGNQFGLSNE